MWLLFGGSLIWEWLALCDHINSPIRSKVSVQQSKSKKGEMNNGIISPCIFCVVQCCLGHLEQFGGLFSYLEDHYFCSLDQGFEDISSCHLLGNFGRKEAIMCLWPIKKGKSKWSHNYHHACNAEVKQTYPNTLFGDSTVLFTVCSKFIFFLY